MGPTSQHPSLLSSQELCKKLHAKIESVDEERYDTEVKLQKTTKEVSFLWSHPSGESSAHSSCFPALLGSISLNPYPPPLSTPPHFIPPAGRLEPETL